MQTGTSVMLAATAVPARKLTQSYWPAFGGDQPSSTTVSAVLTVGASATPDRLALVDAPTRRIWTYAALDEVVEGVAHWLANEFTPGDRIAVWSPNKAEVAILYFAISRARMVLVPVNPALRAGELRYVLEQSGCSAIFHARSARGFDMTERLDAAITDLPPIRTFPLDDGPLPTTSWSTRLPPAKPSDVVQILYTSGTTGAPKGAMLANEGLVHVQQSVVASSGLRDGDAIVNVMPMFHIGGLSHGIVAPALLSGTQIVLEQFTPAAVIDAIEEFSCASLLLAPTMLVDILDSPARTAGRLSSLRSVMLGGALVSRDLAVRVEDELGIPIHNLFGQTETCGPITQTRAEDDLHDRTSTVGRPQPFVEVRIVDPATGDIVPTGNDGEVQVRGRQTMLAYWNMPTATEETLLTDGWLRMGDVGSLDSRGYLSIKSRLKDMIIRGGENIYPREIEDLLRTADAIKDVSVVGIPDPRWGEEVGAVIVTNSPDTQIDVAALHALCRESLAAFKTPKRWFVVDELPITQSGKVRKFELVELIVRGDLTPIQS